MLVLHVILVAFWLALKDIPVSAQAVIADVGEVSDKIVALGNETTLVDEKVCLLLEG